MKAMVYKGPGQKSWEEVADPQILEPTDAIVKIDTTTICGTDLHILGGDVASVEPGRILGHEGVGHVIEVGESVKNFKVGDRVIVSCISKCGVCEYCLKGFPDHCQSNDAGVGWILGHRIDGTLAEKVRTPFADGSLIHLPDNVSDEQAVFLSDALPTGYEVGVIAGHVRPGDVVAVVGAGAVGLSSIMTTSLWGASKVIAIDTNEFRLEKAKEFGATDTIVSGPNTRDEVLALTDGLGVDVAMEAVGYPETLQLAASLVRPRGYIANLGVHGKAVELPLDTMWIGNYTLTMGLVDATSTPTLLKMVASGKLPSEKMGTHTFKLDEIEQAWEVFANAGREKALKVILKAN